MIEYAVYKGDTFIDLGPAKVLATLLGVKETTIKWYASRAGYRRSLSAKRYKDTMIVIKLKGEVK